MSVETDIHYNPLVLLFFFLKQSQTHTVPIDDSSLPVDCTKDVIVIDTTQRNERFC
jgi:hypothetical protein